MIPGRRTTEVRVKGQTYSVSTVSNLWETYAFPVVDGKADWREVWRYRHDGALESIENHDETVERFVQWADGADEIQPLWSRVGSRFFGVDVSAWSVVAALLIAF